LPLEKEGKTIGNLPAYVNINEFTHSHILDKQTSATTNWPKAEIIGRGNNKQAKIQNTGLNKCVLQSGTKSVRDEDDDDKSIQA